MEYEMDRLNIQELIGKNEKQILESIIYKKLGESELKKATVHFGQTSFNINGDVQNKHSFYYNKKPIGYIDFHETYLENSLLNEVFEKVDLLVSRHITNQISRFHLGKGQALIGSSDHILDIENFIKLASKSKHPVIVEGYSGCEKQAVASAIHYSSERRGNSFYELNCSSLNPENFESQLLNLLSKLNGGTLFISEIERLPLAQQGQLIQLLSVKSHINNLSKNLNKTDIRYIISSSQNLANEVKNNRFLESLLREFNYLKIKMPSLKDRRNDIPYILNFLLAENSDGNKLFTEQAISILKNHHWPENYSELERVGIRLIVLSKGSQIRPEDIKKLAPEIFSEDIETINHKILIENLFNSDFSQIKNLHQGLSKSLIYLSENYHKEITLQNLSEFSYVSPSHLSFLFRSNLGKTFKQILAELRIEKIKKSFAEYPNKKITTSSLEVGFGDLSHFEKIFKKYTKMTPREYKNKLKESL